MVSQILHKYSLFHFVVPFYHEFVLIYFISVIIWDMFPSSDGGTKSCAVTMFGTKGSLRYIRFDGKINAPIFS